jgi:hypothetical protein
MGVLSSDWRVVFVYPWWVIAILCFAIGCAGVVLVGYYWVVPTYTLYLIQGG